MNVPFRSYCLSFCACIVTMQMWSLPAAARVALPLAECGVVVAVWSLWLELLSFQVRLHITLLAACVGVCVACQLLWLRKHGIVALLPPNAREALTETYVVFLWCLVELFGFFERCVLFGRGACVCTRTLLEFMTDRTFLESLTKFRPLMLNLNDQEVLCVCRVAFAPGFVFVAEACGWLPLATAMLVLSYDTTFDCCLRTFATV